MGLEENKQLVLDWVAALSAGDADRTCSFYAPALRYFVVGNWALGGDFVTLDALLDGVLRLAEGGRDVFQREVLVDIADGEDLAEDAIETEIPLLTGIHSRLDELLEGLELNVEQIRHRHDPLQLREVYYRSVVATNIQRGSPFYGTHHTLSAGE